jgi:tetratricopeptide (TPR) repeat protein
VSGTGIRPANLVLYAAIAALMVLSLAVQIVRDRGWQPYQPASGVLWIRSGPLAQRLALGFDNLVADAYWIRAVIYFGSQRRATSGQNFDQLYPLLDLVTSLDPYFKVAYRFGSIFLAEPYPGGAGRIDQAVQLLQKGAAADPRQWEYVLDIGFVYYWWAGDFATASEWFKKAGEIPGAAEWLAPLAATTLAEGGNRQSSRQLWTQLRDSSEIEWIRTNASHRLKQLDAMDSIDAINRVSEDFAKRRGRPPVSWEELAADRNWRGLPADPEGVPFALDPATGRVSLGEYSPLRPLPDGSGAARAGIAPVR